VRPCSSERPCRFILFNLFMSAEAAYASPLILMSQNRQADRDRLHAEEDYRTNLAAKEEIETILRELSRLEVDKLDRRCQLSRPWYARCVGGVAARVGRSFAHLSCCPL